jgi:AAA domain
MTAPAKFQFTKAARVAVKLKIGVDGPSGSGKTYGALALAHGITNGGRIAVADSENDSASLYSDRFDFDRVVIPDADPETYKAIIDAAVDGGYDALVIDSLSHAWLSVLAAKEDHERANPKANPWTMWRVFGPKWDLLMAHILKAPIHIVATMRSKQAYEQVDTGGRKQVVKLGMQPQVREGAEYEFGLVFSVSQNHVAEATKDRTSLFLGRQVDLCDAKIHQELRRWMDSGAAPVSAPTPAAPAVAPSDIATPEHKARIAELLNVADIDDPTREKIARRAGKSDLTASRAVEIITGLEKLVPEGQAQ